ncbi:hypothetical protein EJ08DRAFT_586682, partial [Tothia fuscella]
SAKQISHKTMNSAGAKSVLSDDMQNITEGKEDISNKVSGHKANLSNPSKDTSAESKKHSEQVIKDLGGDSAHYGDKSSKSGSK